MSIASFYRRVQFLCKNLFVDQVQLCSHLSVHLLALRDPLLELPAFQFVFALYLCIVFVCEFALYLHLYCICM